MDNIIKVLDEHPECEKYTNDLIEELAATTGYNPGTIREIVDQFRRTGAILTEDRAITRGGGVAGTGLGFPAISLTYGVKPQDTAVTLIHEIPHWAGQYKILSTNKYSNHFTDEVLANHGISSVL